MTRPVLRLVGLAALVTLGTQSASAETIFDVEHARAIARSGGPVNSHDAEYLERWGALSGTPEWRYRTRETWEWYWDDAPRARRHYRRVPRN